MIVYVLWNLKAAVNGRLGQRSSTRMSKISVCLCFWRCIVTTAEHQQLSGTAWLPGICRFSKCSICFCARSPLSPSRIGTYR